MTAKEDLTMSTAKRRRFAAEEKAAILRRHLVEKVPVSDLCDEYGLNPALFYRWQQTLFEHASAAFERRSDAREQRLKRENEALTARLARKDEVIGEIMAEHVALKKGLGAI
jgi:transposase-like protein